MEISSRHSSEARVHWHPAPSCPAQTRRLVHCGNLHMRESERPHQHQGAACLPPLFSRICSVQLPREWRCCHSVSVSRGVAPCHESRDSPSHLINWSAAVYTPLSHNTSHCASLPSARHTISFYLGNSRKGKTLPTTATAVKLRGPIVKLNIRWLWPPGRARISLPQSPRRRALIKNYFTAVLPEVARVWPGRLTGVNQVEPLQHQHRTFLSQQPSVWIWSSLWLVTGVPMRCPMSGDAVKAPNDDPSQVSGCQLPCPSPYTCIVTTAPPTACVVM